MGLEFWDVDGAPEFLKAGFLGFQGAGKSLTATLLAILAREQFKSEGPISMFDTESGSGYLKDHIKALTGKDPLIKRARSFDDLMAWGKKCLESGVSVGIVDSISHPWKELCESYLEQRNEARRRLYAEKGWKFKPQTKLEFQDWGVLKPRWARWTDFYLNSPMHLIVCGRAGYEYDMEQNEETDKKELVKTGVKMKTEGEFGYEPSLLVQMVLDRKMVKTRQNSVRRAVVLKDRFMLLDGKEYEFPSTDDPKKALAAVRKFFAPHLQKLQPGAHGTVDTALKTDFEVDESGDAEWAREKRQRQILCEEIQGELVAAFPGQTAVDKNTKAQLLQHAFGTYSWTAVENLHSDILREGLKEIKTEIARSRGKEGPAEKAPATASAKAAAESKAKKPHPNPAAQEAGAEEAAKLFTDGASA